MTSNSENLNLMIEQIEKIYAELNNYYNSGRYEDVWRKSTLFLSMFSMFDVTINSINATKFLNPIKGVLASYAGGSAIRLGRFKEALEFAELEILSSEGNLFLQARALHNRGLAKHEMGNFTGAEQDYKAALKLNFDDNKLIDGESLKDAIHQKLWLLETERMQHHDRKYLKPSLLPSSILDQQLLEQRKPRINVSDLNNEGAALLNKGDIAGAITCFESALYLVEKHSLSNYFQGLTECNLGNAYLNLKDIPKACEHFEKAVECHKNQAGSEVALAGDFCNLGIAYLGNLNLESRFEKATDVFKQGWNVIRTINPNSVIAIRLLGNLGTMRIFQKDFRRARAVLTKGLEIYEALRSGVGSTESSHEGIFSEYRSLVEKMMFVAFSDNWIDEAMLLSEKAKARIWIERLYECGTTYKQEALIEDVNDIQSISGINGLVINFFVAPNFTFVTCLMNRYIWSQRLDATESELQNLVERVRNRMMSSSRRAANSQEAQELSDLLLDRLDLHKRSENQSRGDIRQIIILPDGPLWHLPFEALPLPRQWAKTYAGKYLCDIAPIYYAPSISVLRVLQKPDRLSGKLITKTLNLPTYIIDEISSTQVDRSFLFIGCSHYQSSQDKIEAPQKQLQLLKSMISQDELTVLFDENATKNKVLEKISNTRYVHFATHAKASEQEGNAFIHLFGTDQAQSIISIPDILKMKLRAELVFLSACETALGRSSMGEGLESLARAFIFAGCNCVVATLWPISDLDAPDLVEIFYRQLFTGKSISHAIRDARIEMRNNGKKVRAWAAYHIVGDAEEWEDRNSPNYLKIPE